MTAPHYTNSQTSWKSFWVLGKNLSNFVFPFWKLHNLYCHNCRYLIILFQNPWSVAILVPEIDNISLKPTGNDSLQCSGSVLTEKFVLTAAHCFFDEIFPLPQQGHSNTTLTKFWPFSTVYSGPFYKYGTIRNQVLKLKFSLLNFFFT